MGKFIAHWFATSVALGVAAWLLPGVSLSGWQPLLVGALVLGLVNAVIRPVLHFFSFPITLVTLGLFALVVNGVSFALAAWLVPGFGVAGLGAAVLGALVVSLVSGFVGWFVEPDDKD